MPAVKGARPIKNKEVMDFHFHLEKNELKIPTIDKYQTIWREWLNYSNCKSLIGLDNFNKKSNQLSISHKKYLIPQPRVSLGLALNNVVNSMIDISDGLIQDATHLAVNSGLCIHLDVDKIPRPHIQNVTNDMLLEAALYGGDDYELLFSCDQDQEVLLKKISKEINVKITKIGNFDTYEDTFLKFKNNSEIPKNKSYLHF